MKSIQYTLLTLLIIAVSFSTKAQKTGDIVEIFGKEKTTSVDEGTVIHEFNNGFTLRNGIQSGDRKSTRLNSSHL